MRCDIQLLSFKCFSKHGKTNYEETRLKQYAVVHKRRNFYTACFCLLQSMYRQTFTCPCHIPWYLDINVNNDMITVSGKE